MDKSKGTGRSRAKGHKKQPDSEHRDSKARRIQTGGLKLDKWQQEALDHTGNLLLCTGRQVGKTTLMAIKASEYMVNNLNSRIIVCSLTEDQAQLIIVMVLDYLQRNYKEYIAKGKKAPTKSSVRLKNGSSILARPVGLTGDSVRGFTGDVLILDEASRFNEFIFTASKPTLLTTGGKIWMCSTPFGKHGYFYECYLNKLGRFKVIETNSWDVVNTRPISESWSPQQRKLAIEFLEHERKDMSKMEFAQEYLGKFVDELRQLFSDDLIKNSCILKREPRSDKATYFLGVDIARMGEDESTFEVVRRITKDTMVHVESIITRKTLTTETFDRIVQLARLYPLKKIGIDAGSGSLGVGVLDFLLREPIVRHKVVALDNKKLLLNRLGDEKRKLNKNDMYMTLLALMEKGRIQLLDDDEVVTSLKSVQYEYITQKGKLTKIRIFGNYTHVVEGLMRAAWLANQKHLNMFIDYI